MTKDEIIAMAHNAELVYLDHGRAFAMWREDHDLSAPLERFAALVAAKEREECAKLCEWEYDAGVESSDMHKCFDTPDECAAAIRARGEQA